MAWSRYLTGDYAGAHDGGNLALEMAVRLEDNEVRTRAFNLLAVVADATGEYEEEQAYLVEALSIAPESDPMARSVLIANLGWTAWKSDDMGTARKHFNSAIEMAERSGGRRNVDDYLFGLSWVDWVEGHFSTAEELAEEAAAMATELGQPTSSAGYQFGVATYAHDGGHHTAVAPALRDSLPVLLESQEDHSLNHWLFAAARAQPDRAVIVRVLGAQAATAERSGFMFGIPIRRDIARLLDGARTTLDQNAFDQAWAEGQAATVEQAGAWALEGLDGVE
jgi:tetratricopeptide (TPR) repeat protein